MGGGLPEGSDMLNGNGVICLMLWEGTIWMGWDGMGWDGTGLIGFTFMGLFSGLSDTI
jgi:hypothetical protein